MAGGLAMYAVLAGVALSQGRGAHYPIAAVQAMLSGKRVLPHHPRPSLAGAQVTDMFVGPLYFFLPAVFIGVVVAMRLRRLGAGYGRRDWAVAAASTAAIAAALMFVVFIVGIGGMAAAPRIQRFSSGYGIRQLGLPGWLLAHAAYVAVVASTMRAVTLRRSRSAPAEELPTTSRARSTA